MRKILPLLLIVLGICAGGAAGHMLRPPPPEPEIANGDKSDGAEQSQPKSSKSDEKTDVTPAFVKLNNQFIVPVVSEEDVIALVVLSLTLETSSTDTESLYSKEPKIRDVALRVLFNHAYAGGFTGYFTAPDKMDALRNNLRTALNDLTDGKVLDVLITDIVRQDS